MSERHAGRARVPEWDLGPVRYPLCDAEETDPRLPDWPHRCVVRVGWHVAHACHCGATWRVSDTEQVDNIRRASGAEQVAH